MSALMIRKMNGETQTITGSVFIRDSSHGMELPPGKKLMTVMGVILVDEASFPHEGETMVQVAGYTSFKNAELVLVGGEKRDDLQHFSADRIFAEPIWRA